MNLNQTDIITIRGFHCITITTTTTNNNDNNNCCCSIVRLDML